MTTTALAAPPAVPPNKKKFKVDWRLALGVLIGLLLLLAIARVVTGANDISSGGAVSAALVAAVPIGLAGLGGLWSERAGVVNIGLEGMLILGTWCGAWGAVVSGDAWVGVIAGIVGGALGGLLHAIATVSFGVDHVVSGVAINILGLGVTKYLSTLVFADMQGGGDTQSPRIDPMTTVGLWGNSNEDRWALFAGADPLGTLEARHWFFVSDLAGVLRGLTTNVSLFTILAILMVPLTFWILWRTAFGLRLRSCGERPVAAESLGVNVYFYKYVAVVVSGAFAGMGGAFLAIVSSGIYREGQTGGRGFIGLATVIFGNWRPGGLAAGAALFGYIDALQLRQGGSSVHALLLVVALLLAAVAVYQFVSTKRSRAALLTATAAIAVLVVFLITDTVPEQFTSFTPHLTTLLVLALASQRLRMPAADGLSYRRGQSV